MFYKRCKSNASVITDNDYLKSKFHSVQNIVRSTFSDRFLLKGVQSAIGKKIRSTCVFTVYLKLKRRWSLKVDRTTFCTEEKSPLPLADVNKLQLQFLILLPHQIPQLLYRKLCTKYVYKGLAACFIYIFGGECWQHI